MKSCPSLKCEWLSKLALLGHAGLVMGSDSLSCYKPQCGAGVKWHIERQREREGERDETEPADLACSLTL